ncbi:hypothetical protein HK102_006093 [Quaeritorhiza haematococci]|nr:hypothetical protein HK102_006093 [Quaeritorhiza haematococci]
MVWDSFKEVEIKGEPEQIWKILQDVSNCTYDEHGVFLLQKGPEWDIDLCKSELTDPIPESGSLEGLRGTVTMKQNQKSPFKFTLQNLKPNQYVCYQTPLPGVLVDWYWDFAPIADKPGYTKLKMGAKWNGVVSFLYKWLLSRKSDVAFDICTKNLKELVETGKVTTNVNEAWVPTGAKAAK